MQFVFAFALRYLCPSTNKVSVEYKGMVRKLLRSYFGCRDHMRKETIATFQYSLEDVASSEQHVRTDAQSVCKCCTHQSQL